MAPPAQIFTATAPLRLGWKSYAKRPLFFSGTTAVASVSFQIAMLTAFSLAGGLAGSALVVLVWLSGTLYLYVSINQFAVRGLKNPHDLVHSEFYAADLGVLRNALSGSLFWMVLTALYWLPMGLVCAAIGAAAALPGGPARTGLLALLGIALLSSVVFAVSKSVSIVFWPQLMLARHSGWHQAFADSRRLTAGMRGKTYVFLGWTCLVAAPVLLLPFSGHLAAYAMHPSPATIVSFKSDHPLIWAMTAMAAGLYGCFSSPFTAFANLAACQLLIRARRAGEATASKPLFSRPEIKAAAAAVVVLGACGGYLFSEASLRLAGQIRQLADSRSSRYSTQLTSDSFADPDPGIAMSTGFSYYSRPDVQKWTDAQFVGHGTGFFVNDTGALVTNNHVVSKCRELVIRINRFVVPLKKVAHDAKNDLALLQAPIQQNRYAFFRNDMAYRIGQELFVFGWGRPVTGDRKVALSSTGQLQSGLLNSVNGLGDDDRYFQLSAPLNPGNSGGAVLDRTGAVAGVASQSLAAVGNSGIGFGLKQDHLVDFLTRNNVPLAMAGQASDLSSEAIGEIATGISRQIFCMR